MEGLHVKKRLNKKFVSLFLALLLLVSFILFPQAASAADGIDVEAEAAIIVDANTGKILYGKNIDTPLAIASMAKMMTEYLLFEAIEDGKITWEQEVIISNYISKVANTYALSNIDLAAGKPYTIKELYEALAIYSANGATIAIAEAIAGTESEFVKMMNAKAQELGLDNTEFVNSTGLNNETLTDYNLEFPEGTDPNGVSVMSARSTAKLAYHLLKDYPEVLETSSVPTKELRGEVMINWNKMLPGALHEYSGVDGLKTGTESKIDPATNQKVSFSNFTGTVKKGDSRIITVIMHAKGDDQRFRETRKMMDYAFNSYSLKEIIPNNYKIESQKSLAVDKGKEDKVDIQTNESISIFVKNGEESAYKPVFTLDKSKLNKEGNLTAPVKQGDVVGTLEVVYEGDGDLGYLDKNLAPKVAVVTTDDVEKANWFALTMRAIGGFFSDLWTSITDTVKGWF